MQAWTVNASKYLVRSKWLTLRSDCCQTHQGVTIDPYYVLEYPDWVQIVAFDDKDRILITEQYRHAIGKTCLEIPCGEFEDNETPLEAAKRELEEETGYVSDQFEMLSCLYANPARQNNKIHCFIALNCSKRNDPRVDLTEIINCRFVEAGELINLIDSNTFSQALHISSILLALRRGQLLS